MKFFSVMQRFLIWIKSKLYLWIMPLMSNLRILSLKSQWFSAIFVCVFYSFMSTFKWFRRWTVCLQCGRLGFDPRVGKIPWRRKWQPTPVLLPRKFHGWRSLVGYSPWGGRVGHDWATSLGDDPFWHNICVRYENLIESF